MSKIINDSSKQCDNLLKHIKKLDQGKQGITGLVEINGIVYVYKISQFMNYLADHECLILNGLNDILEFCPHFCKIFQKNKYPIHPNFREFEQNPFEPCNNPIFLNVLLMEYIENSIPLLQLIEDSNIPFHIIINSIKQILITLIISQKLKKFVHYDLHSLNILMKLKNIDDVHLYILDEHNSFCIPTFGYNPIIIDYGFSSSQDIQNHPSYISLAYTNSGYMSPAFDPIADPKLFLVSLSEDLRENRDINNLSIHDFRNIVFNLFLPLNIDWKSGWDINDDDPIIDKLFDYIENDHERSILFRDYPHFCMDIFQSLITLPLNPKINGSLQELRKSYQIFVDEFYKIELEISNEFYSLYILRQIVDCLRDIKLNYLNPETRNEAILYFKNEIFTQVNKVAKFCSLKQVDFEKVMCSLYLFQEQMEYQLFHMFNKTLSNKFKLYSQLEVQSVEHIFSIFDVNFKNTYIFNNNTTIYVWNIKNKSKDIFTLDDESIKILNNTDSFQHGMFLYQLYTNSV